VNTKAVIVRVSDEAQLDGVRTLLMEYASSLGFGLDFQSFDEELSSLPGRYAPPAGCILLAVREQQLAGCVALRRLDGSVCEMKRLYVRPSLRGLGIGRLLAEGVIQEARRRGYAKMRLDTVPAMWSAQALYESLGFYEIEAYCHNPIPGARFMELAL
jgi:putative acetyltransferase